MTANPTVPELLADRLRDREVCSLAHNSCRNDWICDEAADALERLQAERDELAGQVAHIVAVALPQLQADRKAFFDCATVNGDPSTLDPDDADEVAKYDSILDALTDTASTAKSHDARIRKEVLEEAAALAKTGTPPE